MRLDFMNRKLFVATVTCLAAVSDLPLQAAEQKPNVILILADDLGYEDLGFQGSDRIKTPHLDRLANMGTRFSDGHVSASVCSPSRAGLMTGRYQQRFGHEGNSPRRPDGMDTREQAIGQAFQSLGYRTAIFGKWHLGSEEKHYPTRRGFDVFWGLREGSRTYWYDEKKTDKPGSDKAIEHNGTQVTFDGHLTDRLGDQTVSFIEDSKDKPFFVYLSFTAPHGPLQSKPEDMEALGTDDHYLGLIYGMDRNIGKVLSALERHQLMDNTIIWFLSGNGGIGPTFSNYPLGGKKGFKFEGGHRVPFLLYWKDHVPAGKTYDRMVSALDIYPTSLVAAGGSLIQPREVDGVDLMPYVTGENDGTPHQRLYWRKLECAAMRDGHWKLIRVDGYGHALYNLKDDIAERKDLAAQQPERVSQLNGLLEAWERDKMEPLWEEVARYTVMRYQYHTQRFKTGEIDPMVSGNAPKRNSGNTNKQ
ncbi:sulfatase-like hydrolase/transferase [Novipirellula artificiosorum]|uniref:Arylsulfatase n=1 Tax=Novipirellula artificiosorum TaxID=2528016 RepID=A0A5C6D3F4_9BACT|nr:sulfatase-like hydrolase/transferase [Novipirellula artificiosorum]TWU31743.1 Arylsulfatase precursor [Novipirellula artificiosorum]